MTEELRDAAIYILSTMWDTWNWKPVVESNNIYKEGKLEGLRQSLFTVMLIAQRGK